MDWLSLRAPLEAWLKSAGAAKFSDEDLRVLWQGGYNTLVDLKVATRASLERAGLRPARVDQILSAQGRAGASFEEFWKKLPKAVVAQSSQNFEVLQLADGTAFPDPGHSTTLLVHPCYHTLCKKIFASVGKSDPPSRQVLIRGTPGKLMGLSAGAKLFWEMGDGIGKSTFLDYLLYRLACQGKTVVWCSKSVLDSVLLFTPNGVFEATSTAAFREELRDPSTWFLCDAVEPPSKVAITVMASSPRNSNYNEYAKQAGLRLWMGPWSYVELEAARGIMFSSVSKAKLSELYARWGGIPRYVLKYAANPELQEELDAAVATYCNVDYKCAKYVWSIGTLLAVNMIV
ncbi:hypothetical protein VOLCADRAFT_100790 [Volvox carteri f. nagariensis]|uniref:Uncharacterized protein n=1 Tax=Volvox carteri f. nagariensis TaxID=3068 RepID=D8UL14_VOLCA|nr:uncharacterized protein VOLCADRAFT_100790 [Volvox carteri f. nagariensis]EFJ39586.1 hypothetical protein VOLCADRAFT_100790 [Volvox carteri f. nagariensis]|eukprot:XP_002959350.1 hypothetical protein VOLCADRAFT_100790 [Volvox carteri f. nagariensis]